MNNLKRLLFSATTLRLLVFLFLISWDLTRLSQWIMISDCNPTLSSHYKKSLQVG